MKTAWSVEILPEAAAEAAEEAAEAAAAEEVPPLGEEDVDGEEDEEEEAWAQLSHTGYHDKKLYEYDKTSYVSLSSFDFFFRALPQFGASPSWQAAS